MCRKSGVARKAISLLLLCLMASPVAGQQPEVVTLMSKALANIPDKEGLMITVEYPPGGADPVHRHNAQAFVYVLEGSVVLRACGDNANGGVMRIDELTTKCRRAVAFVEAIIICPATWRTIRVAMTIEKRQCHVVCRHVFARKP
jgi:hypothetical protein